MAGRFDFRGAWDNWRNPALSFREKLRLAVRNNALKLRNRATCCGHPGEPGC